MNFSTLPLLAREQHGETVLPDDVAIPNQVTHRTQKSQPIYNP